MTGAGRERMGRARLGGGQSHVVATAELWLRISSSPSFSRRLLVSHLRSIWSNIERWFLCMEFLVWGVVLASGIQRKVSGRLGII